MSFDKAIKSGKEHRKPYSYCKQVDPSCRNHGGCTWCEENRKHKYIVKQEKTNSRLKIWFEEEED